MEQIDLYGWIEKQIRDLFTYEQKFMFLNGGRGIGKTYTLMKEAEERNWIYGKEYNRNR